jgi:hypothetical protein
MHSPFDGVNIINWSFLSLLEYPEIQPELMIMSSTTSLDTEIDEDYDRQLEDFKRLCFNTVPVDARKKIPVSLNMQDIISKMK